MKTNINKSEVFDLVGDDFFTNEYNTKNTKTTLPRDNPGTPLAYPLSIKLKANRNAKAPFFDLLPTMFNFILKFAPSLMIITH